MLSLGNNRRICEGVFLPRDMGLLTPIAPLFRGKQQLRLLEWPV